MNDGQLLNPGKVIELFELDYTTAVKKPIGWTNTSSLIATSSGEYEWGPGVTYNGKFYYKSSCEFTGMSMESGGKMPQPSFSLKFNTEGANSGITASFLNNGGDFRGMKFTRIVTFEHYLDNGSSPSTSELHRKIQVFYIDQISERFRNTIKFVLSPAVGLDTLNDKANRSLSTNQCNLKYRTWNVTTGSFAYTPVADGGCPWGQADQASNFGYCPSFGTPYFDTSNQVVVSPAQDRCSLSVEGCLKRFPVTLPTEPFPISINLKGGTKGV